MSKNETNEAVFEDTQTAWMCDFDKESIKEKIADITSLSKQDVIDVGVNGQKRLLDIRNYKRIADDLAHQLNIL